MEVTGAPILTALSEQQAELSGLLSGLNEPDWGRPSRCDGWTVADVVLHLAQTNEMAVASVRGRLAEVIVELAGGPAGTVDEGADLMVARERGQPVPVLRDRWQASADELSVQLGACDLHQRLQWVAGELSAQTLATTRLAESWIHTGDVAAAFGRALPAPDRLWHVVRLAWRTLPYAFARAGRELTGPVGFELIGPGGDRWDFGTATTGAEPQTVIRGEALDLCLVAARRADRKDTSLRGDGPDGEAVLDLVRTYA